MVVVVVVVVEVEGGRPRQWAAHRPAGDGGVWAQACAHEAAG